METSCSVLKKRRQAGTGTGRGEGRGRKDTASLSEEVGRRHGRLEAHSSSPERASPFSKVNNDQATLLTRKESEDVLGH